LRCKDIECLRKLQINEQLGNILNTKLWNDVCQAFYNCRIAGKFQDACDCEYEIIEKQISLGLTEIEDCGCET
jgi:hypothetical protein